MDEFAFKWTDQREFLIRILDLCGSVGNDVGYIEIDLQSSDSYEKLLEEYRGQIIPRIKKIHLKIPSPGQYQLPKHFEINEPTNDQALCEDMKVTMSTNIGMYHSMSKYQNMFLYCLPLFGGNLRRLTLPDFDIEDFEILSSLKHLQELTIVSLTKITYLRGFLEVFGKQGRQLKSLKILDYSYGFSWTEVKLNYLAQCIQDNQPNLQALKLNLPYQRKNQKVTIGPKDMTTIFFSCLTPLKNLKEIDLDFKQGKDFMSNIQFHTLLNGLSKLEVLKISSECKYPQKSEIGEFYMYLAQEMKGLKVLDLNFDIIIDDLIEDLIQRKIGLEIHLTKNSFKACGNINHLLTSCLQHTFICDQF